MSYLALTLKNFGEPATALELVELPSEEPKNSEAIISMDAVGMHIADGLFVRGREMITRTMPCVPGFEGVGTVSKIGTGVKNLKEGDKVLLPMGTGSMRQELKIHASQLTKVPKPYAPDEQLALITVNGFTAYFLLKDYRKLKQNDWIIQNAANSNVGRYLIALAKQKGIKTINIVRRKVELKCPTENIPTELIVDLDGVDIGESFKISSVKLEEGVTPTIIGRDFVIATLAAPTVMKEPEKPAEAAEEATTEDGKEVAPAAEGDKKDGEEKKATEEKK